MDSQWDPVNPKYRVRIIKFYENMKYLKKYFFDMNFSNKFNTKPRRFYLKKEDFKNVKDLQIRLDEHDREKFYVVIDSLMCTKTKVRLKDLFEKIQFYLISKNLKEIREFMNRSFFRGPLSIDTAKEFDKRFKIAWEDKFKKSPINIDKYLSTLD